MLEDGRIPLVRTISSIIKLRFYLRASVTKPVERPNGLPIGEF
jgi:hypothetical protein